MKPHSPRTATASASYRPISIVLHWLMGLIIVMTFGLGLYMSDMPFSPDKLRYYAWHKWIGVSLFLLAGLRLGIRMATSPPSLEEVAGRVPWQEIVARWTHRMLYLLMFAVPLSGWLMSSAKGVPTVYFGVWQLPDLLARDAALGSTLLRWHVVLNFTMAGIVLVHIMAALKHHFIDHDGILARMLPGLRIRSTESQ